MSESLSRQMAIDDSKWQWQEGVSGTSSRRTATRVSGYKETRRAWISVEIVEVPDDR